MEWGQMAWFAEAMILMMIIALASGVLGLLFCWFISKKINTLINRSNNPFLGVIIFPTIVLVLSFIIYFLFFGLTILDYNVIYIKEVFFASALIFLINSFIYFFKSLRKPQNGSAILSTIFMVVIGIIVSIYSYYFTYIRDVPGTNRYAQNRLMQIRKEEIFKKKAFSCENMYVYGEKCERMQIIQKAILNKDPALCQKTDTLSSGLSGTYGEFALCIWQFPGSEVAKLGCEKLKKVVDVFKREHGDNTTVDGYLITGKCLLK